MSVCWVVAGCLWFCWGARAMRNLQRIPVERWRVVKKQEEDSNNNQQKNQEKFNYFYCF